MDKSLLSFLFAAGGSFAILALVAGFVPDVSKPEVRHPYTIEAVRTPAPPITRPLGHPSWNIRSSLSDDLPSQQNFPSRQGLLEVREGAVTLRSSAGNASLQPGGAFLEPIIKDPTAESSIKKRQDEQKIKEMFFALGEPLDLQGMPLRWAGEKPVCDLSPKMKKRVSTLLSNLRQVTGISANLRSRISQYKPAVEKYAKVYKIDPGLIYALIYTESDFNPALISSRAAHGLMQVVPNTAGGEVHAWFGRSGLPAAEILLHPETNIRYGTAYFHLLLTRYFKGISNPLTREYCAIASYNGGPWAILKAFGKTEAESFAAINAKTPDDVRHFLMTRLGSRETRAFVRKVLQSKERFTAAL